MKGSFDDLKPIFQQIAEMIEDDILNGIYEEEQQILSSTQIVNIYHINPATAVKGINLLVDRGIIYKKRGIGMFVTSGAKKEILEKRRSVFYNQFVVKLLDEADKIKLTREDIVEMIMKGVN